MDVRDAYYAFTGARTPDLCLMLGDNAYNSGTDSEYQTVLQHLFHHVPQDAAVVLPGQSRCQQRQHHTRLQTGLTSTWVVWGAIGFGALKLSLHRACIAQLFEAPVQVFDAEEIYAKAKTMA